MLYFTPRFIKIVSNYETLILMYQLFSKCTCLHISYTNNEKQHQQKKTAKNYKKKIPIKPK